MSFAANEVDEKECSRKRRAYMHIGFKDLRTLSKKLQRFYSHLQQALLILRNLRYKVIKTKPHTTSLSF